MSHPYTFKPNIPQSLIDIISAEKIIHIIARIIIRDHKHFPNRVSDAWITTLRIRANQNTHFVNGP